jgi:hypothetical protein
MHRIFIIVAILCLPACGPDAIERGLRCTADAAPPGCCVEEGTDETCPDNGDGYLDFCWQC